MIKICHIANHITGKADGVYTHLKMIFRYSDKEKFQHYLIFQGGEKIEKELSEMGIKVFVSESLNKKISVKAFKDVYKFIKENDIAVIHTHLIKPYTIAGMANIILKRKFIFNYHGLFIFNNVYYGVIEKFVYGTMHLLINIFKAINIVLVPSEKSKELLLSETKIFPKPLVYYNGYDFQDIPVQGDKNLVEQINEIKKQNLVIAFIGRLERQKRIDRAFEIFKEIRNQRDKISFLIFGDGEIREMLVNQAKKLNIESKVYFFDYLTNISSYYKYFDIVLFTSDWEGMPLVMWEAMGNKIPVVAPDVGGFKEILEENNCGVVYNSANIPQAVGKLIKLIDDANMRKEFGENGLKAITSKYNSTNFINTIEKIYTDLVS